MFWAKQDQLLSSGESDYYKKWILLTKFGIKPHEIELIPIEDLNALLIIHEYEVERSNHNEFKAEGKK